MEISSEKLQSQKKKNSVGFSLLSRVVDLQLRSELLGLSLPPFFCLSVLCIQ